MPRLPNAHAHYKTGFFDNEASAVDLAVYEKAILWLAENAPDLIYRRLVGMPEELSGLCKVRVGDYRIL